MNNKKNNSKDKSSPCLKTLLETLTDPFCIEQFKEFQENPDSFQTEARTLIDDASPSLKNFIWGISKSFNSEQEGIAAVLGATIVLSLLIKQENISKVQV